MHTGSRRHRRARRGLTRTLPARQPKQEVSGTIRTSAPPAGLETSRLTICRWRRSATATTHEQRAVLDAVDETPTVFETILLRTNLPIAEAAQACDELVETGCSPADRDGGRATDLEGQGDGKLPCCQPIADEDTGPGVGVAASEGAVQLERLVCAPYQAGPGPPLQTSQHVPPEERSARVSPPVPPATLTVLGLVEGPSTKVTEGSAADNVEASTEAYPPGRTRGAVGSGQGLLKGSAVPGCSWPSRRLEHW